MLERWRHRILLRWSALICRHPWLVLGVTLIVALAGLWFGRRIFRGVAVAPDFGTWSYAFLTLLVLLGPAVADSPLGGGLGFGQRLGLFVLIAVYGTVAVAVFDAFWPPRGNPNHE